MGIPWEDANAGVYLPPERGVGGTGLQGSKAGFEDKATSELETGASCLLPAPAAFELRSPFFFFFFGLPSLT